MQFRNRLLSSVSKDDIEWLFPHLQEISLRSGATLYEAGGRTPHVFFPSTAVISVVTVMNDGASVETSSIGREGAVGLLPGLTNAASPTRVFAQIGGGGLRLSSDLLRTRCGESPDLLNKLLHSALGDLAQAGQGVACNALHEASARLARWLLMTEDRVGNATFPLTQEYLAIMVGVQRTTVSLIASRLKGNGLIDYSRGVIEITDRAGLKAVACECYASLLLRYADLGIETAGG
ncbi:MAG TPA: Crp/Fnr family transcriptional regulator [Caulobacteraceae bacterium]|jgi:CRP-like cAMP-binding protein